MLRTSESNARLLLLAAAECGETVNLPVDVARDMARDLLDAHQRQREIDAACAALEALPLKGRAA